MRKQPSNFSAVFRAFAGERKLPPSDVRVPHDIARLRTVLIAVVLVPLGILAMQAAFEWTLIWREAEKELSRTADAAAEHSLRVLATHRIVLARVNDILRGLSDDEIRRTSRSRCTGSRRTLRNTERCQDLMAWL
jgi:hypothetical protein